MKSQTDKEFVIATIAVAVVFIVLIVCITVTKLNGVQ